MVLPTETITSPDLESRLDSHTAFSQGQDLHSVGAIFTTESKKRPANAPSAACTAPTTATTPPAAAATSATAAHCAGSGSGLFKAHTKRHLDGLRFLATEDGECQLFSGLALADQVRELLAFLDRLVVRAGNDVAGEKTGSGCWRSLCDFGQTDTGRILLGHYAQVRRRHAHTDLLGVDDGVDDVGVLAIVVNADPAGTANGQPIGQLLEILAAVGGLVDAAAGSPLLDRVIGIVTIRQWG